jgi:hypothetical protein
MAGGIILVSPTKADSELAIVIRSRSTRKPRAILMMASQRISRRIGKETRSKKQEGIIYLKNLLEICVDSDYIF